jgi:hypothetical protein
MTSDEIPTMVAAIMQHWTNFVTASQILATITGIWHSGQIPTANLPKSSIVAKF